MPAAKDKLVQTRMPRSLVVRIQDHVTHDGRFGSVSEFVRHAVAEKLDRVGEARLVGGPFNGESVPLMDGNNP